MAPKGWATLSSGAWVDDSAAAAGSYFERAPRTHKQAGGSRWSESRPALDSRCGTPSPSWFPVSLDAVIGATPESSFSYDKIFTHALQYLT